MTYRLVESSSDLVLEAEAPDLGAVLVELAKAFTHVTTAGDRIEPKIRKRVEVETAGDLPQLAVAFVNELVFLFATEQFLPAGGELKVEAIHGRHRVAGTLQGQAFDPKNHRFGTEVKAATLHAPMLENTGDGARARVLIDL